MTLQIRDATELPDNATHGFKIVDGDDDVVFMHWHEEPDGMRTSYADVLAATPQRLEEMGFENEVNAILGEIIGRYGAG